MECRGLVHLYHKLGAYKTACPLLAQLSGSNGPGEKENKQKRYNYRGKKKFATRKQSMHIAYPMQEWKQNNLQFVPHMVVIHLGIVLGIREIPTYLFSLKQNINIEDKHVSRMQLTKKVLSYKRTQIFKGQTQ